VLHFEYANSVKFEYYGMETSYGLTSPALGGGLDV
jgi:hypothetical protein